MDGLEEISEELETAFAVYAEYIRTGGEDPEMYNYFLRSLTKAGYAPSPFSFLIVVRPTIH